MHQNAFANPAEGAGFGEGKTWGTEGVKRVGEGKASGREVKVKPLPSKNSGYGLNCMHGVVASDVAAADDDNG